MCRRRAVIGWYESMLASRICKLERRAFEDAGWELLVVEEELALLY
jgi:hypothetical protein